MRRIVSRNNRGVSLVEMMIALVVLLIVFMGLLQASLLSIEHNVRNELRDEAVRIASDRIAELRAAGLDNAALAATGGAFIDYQLPNPADPSDFSGPVFLMRNIRNMPFQFNFQKNISDISADVKQATIRVTWTYKGEALTHMVNATIRR